MLHFVLQSGVTLDQGCGCPFTEGGRRNLGFPGTFEIQVPLYSGLLCLASLVPSNAPESMVSSTFC